MNALVRLLYDLAGRIQDVVDIPFSKITKAKKNRDRREVRLEGKKTKPRDVMISEDTVEAVRNYRDALKKSDSDIMFPPGEGKNPANKWVKRVNKFFTKELGKNV